MIRRLLIANRGEIACRIIKTAKSLNISTVAVFSRADKNARHTQLADESYYIGPAPPQESYLNIEEIIRIAKEKAVDAIHPGYGFLAENVDFAKACGDNNIIFVGPPIAAMQAMADKETAKNIMRDAGVPVVPGCTSEELMHAENDSSKNPLPPSIWQKAADDIGYPLLIKAIYGGGGKGMRLVENPHEFTDKLQAAQREANAFFGHDEILLEKYLHNPRHIEVQVFADQHGNVVHLFERDCSVQRHQQKIIEEAPAADLSNALRDQLGQAAVQATKAIQYEGTGTVEFLLDEDDHFYFMEMNTRLQVEHPVTEAITDLDLVEWQLHVAQGDTLAITQQKNVVRHGYAIEARLYAEDPERDYLPTSGKLIHFDIPTDDYVRVDAGYQIHDQVSIYYDALLCKIIAYADDRQTAIERLYHAIADTQVVGVTTNRQMLLNILANSDFQAAKHHTQWLSQQKGLTIPKAKIVNTNVIVAATTALLLYQQQDIESFTQEFEDQLSPWFIQDSWQNMSTNQQKIELQFNECIYTPHDASGKNSDQMQTKISSLSVFAEYHNDYWGLIINDEHIEVCDFVLDQNNLTFSKDDKVISATVVRANHHLHVFFDQTHWQFTVGAFASEEASTADSTGRITAPMPGTVVSVDVSVGDKVTEGDRLVVMEAMKMEHTLYAPFNAIVDDLPYKQGDLVSEGDVLVSLSS